MAVNPEIQGSQVDQINQENREGMVTVVGLALEVVHSSRKIEEIVGQAEAGPCRWVAYQAAVTMVVAAKVCDVAAYY